MENLTKQQGGTRKRRLEHWKRKTSEKKALPNFHVLSVQLQKCGYRKRRPSSLSKFSTGHSAAWQSYRASTPCSGYEIHTPRALICAVISAWIEKMLSTDPSFPYSHFISTNGIRTLEICARRDGLSMYVHRQLSGTRCSWWASFFYKTLLGLCVRWKMVKEKNNRKQNQSVQHVLSANLSCFSIVHHNRLFKSSHKIEREGWGRKENRRRPSPLSMRRTAGLWTWVFCLWEKSQSAAGDARFKCGHRRYHFEH